MTSIESTVDTKTAVPGVISQHHNTERMSADTVEKMCRNCGRELKSVTDEYCGQRDCDERAAFASPRMTVIEQSEPEWAYSVFQSYINDPRVQVVQDAEPGKPAATREPNVLHVMRMIARGIVEEATPGVRERAQRYCDEFRGV